jgi:hypothetical protein
MFLAQGATKRLRLEQLPGYAPDLNPDEGIWAYLKYVELRNVCCTDLVSLAMARYPRVAEVVPDFGHGSPHRWPGWSASPGH